MKDKIRDYLIDGVKPAQVATIMGCSPGYISQLLSDPEYKASVEAGMLANQKPVDERLDARYTSLEADIIATMHANLAQAEFGELRQALDSVVKAQDLKARRKMPAPSSPGSITNVTVSVALPAHALRLPQAVLNETGEVIAIDNKPLAPMSAGGVKNLFSQIKERREANEFAIPANSSDSVRPDAIASAG